MLGEEERLFEDLTDRSSGGGVIQAGDEEWQRR
jgi:hypothetical protein